MPLLALARGVSAPVPVVTAAPSTPIVSATRTWPRLDVPSLLNYELGQFADLSGRTVNVREYGARGDGATNDTAAVQSAINAGNGGTVYFPSGIYVLDSVELAAGARIRLLGAGQGITILKHADGATASMLRAIPQVVAQFQVESLTLDGNMNGVGAWDASAIEVQADRLLVQNVEATRTVQQAISLPSTTYTSIIRDSWFHDFRLHGPSLNQDTRAVNVDHLLPSDGDVWFVNNRVEMTSPPSGAGNSVGGFRSEGHLNTRLFYWKNVFHNVGQDWPQEYLAPIDIYRNGDGSVIWQNQLYNSYYTPIRVMRSNDVQVIDNTVDGEGHVGPAWGGGIDFQGRSPDTNMHGMVVRGNTLRNLADAQAITMWFDPDGVMSDVTIDGNTIDHAAGAVYLSYVRGPVRVTNNTATNYGSQGLAIDNADPSSTQVADCGNSWSAASCSGAPAGPTSGPQPTATRTPTTTPQPPATSVGELAVAFAEASQQPGVWSVQPPYQLAVNWSGSTGARPIAVAYAAAPTSFSAIVTGPTITNASEQNASGGSLLLVQGSGMSVRGTTPATHVHGVNGGSTATLATPAGLHAGDLVAVYINTSNTIAAPSGWTLQRQDGQGTIWTRAITGVPDTLGDWSTAGNAGWTFTAVALGATTSGPTVIGAGGGGAETTATISTGSAATP